MAYTNELDLVVKYAGKKGGSADGQLVIEDVELNEARDNRNRHGIGNEDPQYIEKGNKTYTFDTTAHMNSGAVDALKNIDNGDAETQAVYMKHEGQWEGSAAGLVTNDITASSSDGGDTTLSISADLLGVEWTDDAG